MTDEAKAANETPDRRPMSEFGKRVLEWVSQSERTAAVPQSVRDAIEAASPGALVEDWRNLAALGLRLVHRDDLAAAVGHVQVMETLLPLLALTTEFARAPRLLRYLVAVAQGDLDAANNLWGQNVSDSSDGPQASPEFFRSLVNLRRLLANDLGEEHAALLAGLPAMALLRLHRSFKRRVGDNPWLLSDDCAAQLARHVADCPAECREQFDWLRDTLNYMAGRSEDVLIGTRRFDALQQMAAARVLPGVPLAELFDSIDAMAVSALEATEADGVSRRLHGFLAEHPAELATLWLLWRSVQHSTLPEPDRRELAGLIGLSLRPRALERAVALRRRTLFEYAVSGPGRERTIERQAHLHYALAHTLRALTEYEGDHEALLKAWQASAWQAMVLSGRSGEFWHAADSLDGALTAQSALARLRGEGGDEGVQQLRGWLANAEDLQPELRAIMMRRLGMLLLSDTPDPDSDPAREAHATLDSATIVFEGHPGSESQLAMIAEVRGVWFSQLAQRGKSSYAKDAGESFQRALDLLKHKDDEDREPYARIIREYAKVLRIVGQNELAMEWLNRALSRTHLATPTRIQLLLDRAELRVADAAGPSASHEQARDDLAEARELLGPDAPVALLESVMFREQEVLAHLRDAASSLRALDDWEELLGTAKTPRLAAWADARRLERLLQRDAPGDSEAALVVLDRALARSATDELEVREQTLSAVHEWLRHAANHKTSGYSERRMKQLAALATGSSAREQELRLLLDMLRHRATGAPTLDSVLGTAMQLAYQHERESDAHVYHLTGALFFARVVLPATDPRVRGLAEMVEEWMLAQSPRTFDLGQVGVLLDLARGRLEASEEPSLHHADSALKLLAHADRARPFSDMPEPMRTHAYEHRLMARLRALRTRPGQVVDAMLRESEALVAEIRRLLGGRPDREKKAASDLWFTLHSYPALEPTRLRERAGVVAAQFGLVNEQADDGMARVAALIEQRLVENPEEAAALISAGLTSDDAAHLLRAEQWAMVGLSEARAADRAIRLLEPLSQRFTQLPGARVYRVLGRTLLHYPSAERPRLWPKAIAAYEQAYAMWPPNDLPERFDVLEEAAQALWRAHGHSALPESSSYGPRAQALLDAALNGPHLAGFAVAKARLLRMRGLVAQSLTTRPFHRELEPMRRALAFHEQALGVCPQGAHEDRYQILITLANALRDLYDMEEEPAIIERAIALYRETLQIAAKHKVSLLHDTARVQKCFADALRMRGSDADLEEAQGLLSRSLAARGKERPIERVESLVSLAHLELARHGRGMAGALDAAREAVNEGESLLLPDSEPALSMALSQLRRQIATEGGGRKDAAAENSAEAVLQRRLMELEFRLGIGKLPAKEAQLLREELAQIAVPLGLSSLLSNTSEAAMKRMSKLLDQLRAQGAKDAHVPIAQAAVHLERLVSNGSTQEALQYLTSICMGLCGNSPSWSLDEYQKVARFIDRLLSEENLSSLPWEAATLLRHQAAYLLRRYESALTPQLWDLMERLSGAAVLELQQRAPEDGMLVEILQQHGIILFRRRDRTSRERRHEAMKMLERALVLARKHNSLSCEVTIMNDIGTLLDAMADENPRYRDRALAIYSEVIERIRRIPVLRRPLCIALGNRGWLRSNLPLSEQPSTLHLAAADIKECLGLLREEEQEHRARNLNHLGMVYMELCNYERDRATAHAEEAFRTLSESRRIYQAQGDLIEAARAEHNLGLLLMRTGGPAYLQRALMHLVRALRYRRGRLIEEWETLGTIVDLRARMGSLGRLSGDQLITDEVDRLAGQLLAAGLVERGLRCRSYGLMLTVDMDSLTGAGMVPGSLLARVEQAVADAEEMWYLAESSHGRILCAQHLAEFCAMRAVLGELAGESPETILRHSTRGKARSLLTEVRTDWGLDGVSAEAWSELAVLRRQIGELRADTDAAAAAQLVNKERAYQALLRRLTGQQQVLDLARLEHCLRDYMGAATASASSPGIALIDVTVAEIGSVVTIALLRGDRLAVTARRLPLSTHDVARWLHGEGASPGWLNIIARQRQAWHTTDPQARAEAFELCAAEGQRILTALYTALLAPIGGELRAAGVQRLLLALPGSLATLPISAACYLNSDGTPRYLLEDFRSMVMVPSAAAVESGRSPGVRTRRAVAVVTENQLPGAERVAEQMKQLWQASGFEVQLLSESQSGRDAAVADAVLEAVSHADLIHFLCHGSFDPRAPERSGLHLRDGQLLTLERLTLHSQTIPAELVVLAACRSGVTGPGDLSGEWLSIAGALVRAGARMVVATLWDVSYPLSVALSRTLYSAYLDHGLSAAEALAHAMRRLLSEGRIAAAGQGPHPALQDGQSASEPRLRRVLASPLFWAGYHILGC